MTKTQAAARVVAAIEKVTKEREIADRLQHYAHFAVTAPMRAAMLQAAELLRTGR